MRDGKTAVLGQQHSVGVLKPLFDLLDCGCLVWPRHGVPFISRPVRPDTQKKRSTQEGVKRLTPDSERKPAEVSRAHLRGRSEEHTSELQSRFDLVCRLLLEKKKK